MSRLGKESGECDGSSRAHANYHKETECRPSMIVDASKEHDMGVVERVKTERIMQRAAEVDRLSKTIRKCEVCKLDLHYVTNVVYESDETPPPALASSGLHTACEYVQKLNRKVDVMEDGLGEMATDARSAIHSATDADERLGKLETRVFRRARRIDSFRDFVRSVLAGIAGRV